MINAGVDNLVTTVKEGLKSPATADHSTPLTGIPYVPDFVLRLIIRLIAKHLLSMTMSEAVSLLESAKGD